ncbi:MAG: hypothetical protein ACRD51_07600 [Candidatus Acidiferrum sp.]
MEKRVRSTPSPCFLQEYDSIGFKLWGSAKNVILKGIAEAEEEKEVNEVMQVNEVKQVEETEEPRKAAVWVDEFGVRDMWNGSRRLAKR